MFTDKNRRIIQDNSLDKEDMNGSDITVASDHNNSEITWVSTEVSKTNDTTGVDEIAETAETGSNNMVEHTERETYSKDTSINHMDPQ